MKHWPKLISLGLGLLCLGSNLSATETQTQQAGWRPYDLDFPYMGTTTYYSCTGLEDRLEQLLKQLGARADVRVSALGCAGNQVSKMLSTRIHVSLPSTAGDAEGERFVVTPATVKLRTHEMGGSGAGDCELLEQMRDRLLPKLELKVVDDDLHCTPGQAVGNTRTLQVTALLPEKKTTKTSK